MKKDGRKEKKISFFQIEIEKPERKINFNSKIRIPAIKAGQKEKKE
jgi:hypothetical protein